MKNIVLLVILIMCFQHNILAQLQGKIKYIQDFKLSEKSYPIYRENVLIVDDSITLFVQESINNYERVTRNDEGRVAIRITPDGKDKKYVYKNFKTNKIYTNYIILNKYVLQRDSLNIFNWRIIDKFKEINGYKCQKATTTFRGRNYIAYFTESIPISSGPWKFGGLPGLILEIIDDENKIKMTAISTFGQLTEVDEKTLKNTIVKKNKSVNWEGFKKKYIQAHKNFTRSMNSKFQNSKVEFNISSNGKIPMGFEIFNVE
ncbi:MAG: GLPGLI family protein [Bacteroidetes bacterium]|nr:GLPGLI family protein [Bacteroidota bacterium]